MSDDDGWFSSYTEWAISVWIGQFVFAFYACTIANWLFGIPLGNVVDVLLSLQITAPLAILTLYVVSSAFAGDFSDLFDFLLSLVAYVLTPFTAIMGYQLYGQFFGQHLGDTSFVYSALMDYLRVGLQFIAHVGTVFTIPNSDFIGSPQFFNWSQFLFSALSLAITAFQILRNSFTSSGARNS